MTCKRSPADEAKSKEEAIKGALAPLIDSYDRYTPEGVASGAKLALHVWGGSGCTVRSYLAGAMAYSEGHAKFLLKEQNPNAYEQIGMSKPEVHTGPSSFGAGWDD